MDVLTEAMDVLTVSLLTEATDAPTEDMVATDVATSARGKLRLLLRLKLMLTTATVMDVAMEVTGVLTDSLLTVATDALTEDMEATGVATMARGRLRLLLRLRPIPTMALTDMVDFLTEAMDVLSVFLLTVVMAALTEDMEATDVATTARGRLRLLLRPRLLTDTAMDAALEAMVATAAPTEDMVGTGLMAAMAALTGMATESRQQPEHQHYMNNLELVNMNLTKYKFMIYLKKK